MKHYRPKYNQRDWEVIDYQMYCLGDTELYFRGPDPGSLTTNEYFVCIGAAQTFGCFCSMPFSLILENELGLKALNLGYGGVGPLFFLNHEALLHYINHAKFVIVQVMSGRSENNSVFNSGGLEYLTKKADGTKISAVNAYQELLEQEHPFFLKDRRLNRWAARLFGLQKVKKVIAETRGNWISSYQNLLNKITVPKILFWFSKRSPFYHQGYHNVQALFGVYPQLVNAKMLEAIESYADKYVQCVTRRGSPQPLYSRFTGQPTTVDCSLSREDFNYYWTHNSYYPSPEMHEDAAQALVGACKEILLLRSNISSP